ncbi:auxin-responsive protein SAUR72-like [Hevea brasiliensis]|nr:auxin-responsive protein SAUR72-like [Hevea brasiliensis]
MGVRASKLGKLIAARSVKRLGGPPPLAPKGYVPICVGVNGDTRRFIVHRKALGDAEFLELLCKSAEEYGFCNEGVLRIPYEAKDFEAWMIRKAKLRITPVNPMRQKVTLWANAHSYSAG